MIEPTNFGFNLDAAETNKFQKKISDFTPEQVHDLALMEFNNAVAQLRAIGIEVITIRDLDDSTTPDSIFPNNWFSTHQQGQLVTYPMSPESRRAERRKDIIEHLESSCGYIEHIALEIFEEQDEPRFLEGTGSLVLDRVNRIAYAALSPRTEQEPLQQFCEILEYKPVTFRAYGPTQEPIYHTNVMMSVGDTFAIVGLDVIEEEDRQQLIDSLTQTGKEIIELTEAQTHHHFAGNMLQLENKQGEKVLVLSKAAFESLTEDQLEKLLDHNQHLLPLPIHVIEKVGGGSVRCMIAEIFKPAAKAE